MNNKVLNVLRNNTIKRKATENIQYYVNRRALPKGQDRPVCYTRSGFNYLFREEEVKKNQIHFIFLRLGSVFIMTKVASFFPEKCVPCPVNATLENTIFTDRGLLLSFCFCQPSPVSILLPIHQTDAVQIEHVKWKQ